MILYGRNGLQEAFLHVPDKGAAIAQAARLQKPGGRMVFTDWVRHGALSGPDEDLLWRGLGAQTLQSIASYEAILDGAGLGPGDPQFAQAYGRLVSLVGDGVLGGARITAAKTC